MFKMRSLRHALLLMLLGAALTALAGCEPAQVAADQGLTDGGKVTQRAWWWYWPPPKK